MSTFSVSFSVKRINLCPYITEVQGEYFNYRAIWEVEYT